MQALFGIENHAKKWKKIKGTELLYLLLVVSRMCSLSTLQKRKVINICLYRIYVANTLKSATINILFLLLVLPTHKIRSNYLKSSHIMWRVFMFSFWGILILWIWIFSFFGNFTNQNSLQGRKLIITHR